ncbi:MAG: hypothetical protein Q9163_004428 [Psora crenata]
MLELLWLPDGNTKKTAWIIGTSGAIFSTNHTLGHNSPPEVSLELNHLPPVYVLASHLSNKEQHEAEDVLSNGGAPLTYDIKEAKLVLGNISRARRAKLELLWKGVQVIEDEGEEAKFEGAESTSARKRRKIEYNASKQEETVTISHSQSETGSETDKYAPASQSLSHLSISQSSLSHALDEPPQQHNPSLQFPSELFNAGVVVARLDWLHESVKASKILSLDPYLLYKARIVQQEHSSAPGSSSNRPPSSSSDLPTSKTLHERPDLDRGIIGIIERAKTDKKPARKGYGKRARIKEAVDKDLAGQSFSPSAQASKARPTRSFGTRPTHLLHQTTSEHEEAMESSLPPMPDWVVQNKIYSCERATPPESLNDDFIIQLKHIKLARVLMMDDIGVRAYSTSIASVAAYPYRLENTNEILALPGCDQKIAQLFHEYNTNNGHIQAVADIQANPILKVLREFYDIWGVGATTAREFYYDKGWRDLDDIVEYGWKSLTRVQQIGVKYYDEFQLKIPRTEVESIAATITEHAKGVTDSGIETIIVGGYRRGKRESGDVDVILSHREQNMTYELVTDVVDSLERDGWITHCLMLNLTNTKRNQEPVAMKPSTMPGHGFDTLDKALVVWQDPHWPTKASDLAVDPKAKNPNPHRRVDIIISPWRTVGCAVEGWTSGTTFQRDLRRYCRKVKGWKFDSSGVRERGTGAWVDLEGWRDEKTRCNDWQTAEKRVFEGLGLVYREPWDRCTG